MSGTYTQIYIHVVFAVKGRENLFLKPWRDEIFKYMSGIIKEKHQKPIIVNGVEDHVHLFIGLKPIVGETSTALNRGTTLETTMDNFLLQALLESTGAQLAFSNGWRYGAPIVPGPITLNDLDNMIPMNPPVSTVELSGEEIKEMLELVQLDHKEIKVQLVHKEIREIME